MKEKKDLSENKSATREQKVILVGNANVGKSVVFSLLTGTYAIVSNYPGTTVEISQGRARIQNRHFIVIDTPGVVDFLGRTDDQKVTRDILLDNPDAIFVNIIDAKNLNRGLVLSLYLCELGVKHIIVLNMMDEANDRGIFIDHRKLSEIFRVNVVPMIATERVGLQHLKKAIIEASFGKCLVSHTNDVERVITSIEEKLPDTNFKKKGLAVFLAGATDQLGSICSRISGVDLKNIETVWENLQYSLSQPIYYLITTAYMKQAEYVASLVSTEGRVSKGRIHIFLSRLTIHPVSGIFIAVLVLFFMYIVVGKFGAGFLVDIFEKKLFGNIVNPFFINLFSRTQPLLREFFVGDYGVITMALSYGLGIVLPITAVFFLFFGFLEDCGYFPRLAFLTDRVFKSVGLTGKAILPIVLGFGCGTMATLTTRILDTRKEKIIATILLAVAIPCSAQLGVVLGILGSISKLALLIWAASILIVMIIVGSAVNLLIPGDSSFSMEIPPLRMPHMRNIGIKTGRRVLWYLREALPFFILGTIILFLLDVAGVLARFISILSPVVTTMGLPLEMSRVFIMGFLRRDYGAAGMFDLFNRGVLDVGQSVVSAVTLTLFVPCVAQFFVMIKERGFATAIFTFLFATIIAFVVGIILNAIITVSGLF
ncbi:MAG: ferrous iron transport protein B [Candidatus Omnitrophica bacterium]|nr:ferrous iron transport protein B [Candidatus Omnitrophota bacterium]MCM8828181.1 ferrous iron transport protein B [Candidatus Omnitrophota bacterium]